MFLRGYGTAGGGRTRAGSLPERRRYGTRAMIWGRRPPNGAAAHTLLERPEAGLPVPTCVPWWLDGARRNA
jgi:hypothetical protein